MVIPQYPPPVIGGMERQCHELARALASSGLKVTVISGRTLPDQPASSVEAGVQVLRVPFPRRRWLRFPVTTVGLIRTLIGQRNEFDVVHVHTMSWFGSMATLLGKLLGKPVLAKLPTGLEWAFGRRSLRFAIFRRCDAIALLSPDTVEQFRTLGYPDARIFKITNGVSLESFGRAEPPAESAPDTPLRVIFVGRLDPEKGLLDILATWSDVVAGCERPVRLVICGEGPFEAELRRAIIERGVEDSVELRGHVPNVQHELAAADVFVLPSFIEGNSNAILEAMAASLPIVSTAVGGTPLLVGPEGADWLIAVHDQARLRALLLRLLNQSDTRRQLGDAMARRVREHMAIESVAERYRAAYARLAAGQRDLVGAESSGAFDGIMHA
ncbi:MAG: glycosyltransferase family 4 protein [Deltaproteobacteria bacterium]|nr:glycosyltransferase family 4 protein [Deltaproteobacteria bacterium]MBW2696644.1 glycosyltransferase family 4 protein [Deltaproteobacteria bacterium]